EHDEAGNEQRSPLHTARIAVSKTRAHDRIMRLARPGPRRWDDRDPGHRRFRRARVDSLTRSYAADDRAVGTRLLIRTTVEAAVVTGAHLHRACARRVAAHVAPARIAAIEGADGPRGA